MARSAQKKIVLTTLVIAGAILAMSQMPSSADHRAPHADASSTVANQAIGWETTLRELSVGP